MNDISKINIIPRPEVSPITWRTRSGDLVLVTHMDDQHLTNAYLLCERNMTASKRWMLVFKKEAKRRGFNIIPQEE